MEMEKRMWLEFPFKFIIFIQISVIILYPTISLFFTLQTPKKILIVKKKLNYLYEFYSYS